MTFPRNVYKKFKKKFKRLKIEKKLRKYQITRKKICFEKVFKVKKLLKIVICRN